MAGTSGRNRISQTTDAIYAQNRAWRGLSDTISSSLSAARSEIDQTSQAVVDHAQAWNTLAQSVTAATTTATGAIGNLNDSAEGVRVTMAGLVESVAQVSTLQLPDMSVTQSGDAINADEQRSALNKIDEEIDDQASHWSKLKGVVLDAAFTVVTGYAERVIASLAQADSAIDQHRDHFSGQFTPTAPASQTTDQSTIRSQVDQTSKTVAASQTETRSQFSLTGLALKTLGGAVASHAASTAMNYVLSGKAAKSYAQISSEGISSLLPFLKNAGQSTAGFGATVANGLSVASAAGMSYAGSFSRSLLEVDPSMAAAGQAALSYGASVATSFSTAGVAATSYAARFVPALLSAGQASARFAAMTISSLISTAPAFLQISAAALNMATSIGMLAARLAPTMLSLAGPVINLAASFAGPLISSAGLAVRAIAALSPHWKLATAAIVAGGVAYRGVAGEMASESYKASAGNANVTKSVGELGKAVGDLSSAASSPLKEFGEGIASVSEKAISYINPFPFLAGKVAKSLDTMSQTATSSLKWLTSHVVEFGDIAVTAAFVTSSWGDASAEATQKFYEQGKALREIAAHSEAAIARMENQREAFQKFSVAQEKATEQAKHNAEVSRIGSITTIAGINAEEAALRDRSTREIQAEQNAITALRKKGATKEQIDAQIAANDAAAKQRADKVGALANRRQEIESGQVTTPIDDAIKSAREEVLKLKEGQDAAAIATLQANAKTAEEKATVEALIPVLKAEQAQIKALTEEKEHEKRVAEAAAAEIKRQQQARDDMMREAQAINQKVAETTTSLKDKIDVLSGSATQAEVSMRELARQGIKPEDVQKIADLNAEVAKLTTAEKAADKITSIKDQIDLLNGSATQAEITMRELGRAGFTDEQIAEIGALTEELDALKDKQKDKGKGKADGKSEISAAFAGSKEAAEIMLRGVGGGSKMETLAQQQLAEQKKIATAVSKPPVPAPPMQIPPLPEPAGVAPVVPPNPVPNRLAPLSLVPKPLEMVAPPPAIEPPVVAVAPLPEIKAPPMEPPVILQPNIDPPKLARAVAPDASKISGVSARVTEPRREERSEDIVKVLKSQLEEQKKTTSAVQAIEFPTLVAAEV